MILDSDSIDTLPSDLSTSPGTAAEDDVIFEGDHTLEVPPTVLPGILEEAEEVDDPPPLGDFHVCDCVEPSNPLSVSNAVPSNDVGSSLDVPLPGIRLEENKPESTVESRNVAPPVVPKCSGDNEEPALEALSVESTTEDVSALPEVEEIEIATPVTPEIQPRSEIRPAEQDLEGSSVITADEAILSVPDGASIHSESSSAFAVYTASAKSPESPNKLIPTVIRRQSLEDARERKGVLTKILEFVGVKRKEEEVPSASAVFYDNPEEKKEVGIGVEGIQDILNATDLSAITEDTNTKKRTPSPRIDIVGAPKTHVIAATPPTSPGDKPPRRDPDALTVDNEILNTPPVVKKKTSMNELDRQSLIEEIEGIIAKAKLIAADQTEDDPIYSNAIKSVEESVQPPIAICDDFEEIKVTSPGDRGRPRETASSKLSGKILKAIPSPRRKPISDAEKTAGQTSELTLDRALDVSHSTPVDVATNVTDPPPVPPRRRRSKQRQEPQPPPKRRQKK